MSVNFGFSFPALAQYGGGGNNPFGQLGPTLDMSFVDGATGVTNLNDPNGYTLTTNFITPEYQVAAQYTIWETNVGLVSKTFADIITFTRASSATFVGSNGLIQSATTNTPRFDYDPVTLAAKGLLIEEQRTNGFLYSQDFTNAYWNYSNAVTITANVTTAPDGTATGNLVVPNAGTVNARTGRNSAGTGGVNRTYSFYVKANGIQYITVNTSSSVYGTCFDIINGTKIDPTSGVVGTPSITNAGNGWWRVTHTTATGTIPTILPGTTFVRKGTSDTDTFNGTDGFYIWGAQWEDTVIFATSYIPTVASQVTRSQDFASVNTLSPWYNSSAGTFFVEVQSDAPANGSNLMGFAAKQGATGLAFLYNGGNYRSGGASINLGFTQGVSSKYALAYTNGVDRAGARDGGAVLTSLALTDFSLIDSVSMSNFSGAAPAVTRIKRFAYYPRRLSNAELQAITA